MTSPSANSAEINVTPLIDVLLVLLIIFMVITPLSPRGLQAELPQDAGASSKEPEPMIIIEITGDHRFLLNGREVPRNRLATEIKELYKARADRQLFIRGDKDLEYQEVALVMDDAKGANNELQFGLLSRR